MQKIDYLEQKVNDILHELNYLKTKNNELSELMNNVQTENYLINPDFSIDQNKKSVYTNADENTITNAVDAWNVKLGTYTKQSLFEAGYNGEFSQTINENYLSVLLNKTATLTFYINSFSHNGIYIGARIIKDDGTEQENKIEIVQEGINSISFNVPEDTIEIVCFIKVENTTDTIQVYPKWAKLEVGLSFTEYIPPIKSLELLKCNENKSEFCEVLYDKNSTDDNINWGLTSGIQGADSKSGLDFSKYKALRFHILFGNKITHIALMSLENPTPSSTRSEFWSSIKVGDENGTQNFYYALLKVANLKSFANIGVGYFSGSTKYPRNNNSSYYVYKIEGIY